MKIIFMGTPDFSAVVFEKLNSVYPVSAVVTGIDKPVGRKMVLTPCPLKASAMKAGVPVLQYEKVSREGIEDIEALAPDLVITAAFGQILSDRFLAIPRLGVINVHASLLPLHRGASPIQSSMLAGDKVTGITIMKTVKEVDAGDMLLKKEIEISPDDYADTLFDKMAVLGGDAIVEAVRLIDEGRAVFTPQDHSKATHCVKISKAEGKINFDTTAEHLRNFVHAMNPWPSAYTYLNGKLLKVIDVDIIDDNSTELAGTVIKADRQNGIVVKCADKAVRLKLIQLEGKGKVDDLSFLNGNKDIAIGVVLG
ncbi:MAG: methionyl-tRNA formyltransferase [Clostridia bacterium]|nr:methionyl-tRNA formyltransferase [Clostridia bacterium]